MRALARRRLQGRDFSAEELAMIRQVVSSCGGASRWKLAVTICERLEWRRPAGGLKGRECRDLLEKLEGEGWLVLPPLRRGGRPRGSRTRVPMTTAGEAEAPLVGTVRDFGPVVLEPVEDAASRRWFRELVGRYHPLGFRVPFGAHLRYLAFVSQPQRRVAGVVQFSSPAWRIAVRDRWIGWEDGARQQNLQRIVQNSRFCVLPRVRVRNLASTMLSVAVRRLPSEWRERYGVEPLLVETLVDAGRYRGSCYLGANWIELGRTTGRGRMDRGHRRHGAAPKSVLVYPLVREARRQLREG